MILEKKSKKTPVNKKIATMALAGALAMGAFTAAPAYAGGMNNGCNANGCKSETRPAPEKCPDKAGCQSKSGCQGKTACQTKSSCKSMNKCKSANSCKTKADKGTADGHEDSNRYND